MSARRSAFKRTKRLFVVATEGAETEPLYFQEFHPGRDGGFRLKILGNLKHKSRPLEVLSRLIEYETRERPGPNTEYWAVIDRDDWSEVELREMCTELAKRKNFHLAMSNPCFELWLWLHLRPNRAFGDRHDCQRSLKREWPQFSKENYDAASLMPMVPEACRRARKTDDDPDRMWPRNQTTTVYRLVEKLH